MSAYMVFSFIFAVYFEVFFSAHSYTGLVISISSYFFSIHFFMTYHINNCYSPLTFRNLVKHPQTVTMIKIKLHFMRKMAGHYRGNIG